VGVGHKYSDNSAKGLFTNDKMGYLEVDGGMMVTAMHYHDPDDQEMGSLFNITM
jgi:hypothetical protein